MAMTKFFPIYTAEIQGAEGNFITVTEEYDSKLSISKKIMGDNPNSMELVIYNLGEAKRDLLFYDPYEMTQESTRTIKVTAGYKGYSNLVFDGVIIECYSVRRGVNFETHVVAWEGGLLFTKSWASQNIAGGSPQETLNYSLQDALAHGVIGEVQIKQLQDERAKLVGEDGFIRSQSQWNAYTNIIHMALNDISGTNLKADYPVDEDEDINIEIQSQNEEFPQEAFMEGDTLTLLQASDYIDDGEIVEIRPDTGLIETPRKSQFQMTITTVFEPMLKLARLVRLVSHTAPRYSGEYKILEYEHNVTFGRHSSARNETKVIVFRGNDALSAVSF